MWEVTLWLALLLTLFAWLSFFLLKAGESARIVRAFSHSVTAFSLFALCLGGALIWRWDEPRIGMFGTGLAFLLAWNAATRDREIVAPSGLSGWLRLLLVVCVPLCALSPVLLLLSCLFLHLSFGLAEHHATLPLRLLLAVAAFSLADALCEALVPQSRGALLSAFAWLLVTIVVSHYLIAGLAKMFLGPRPWSWALRNRLHYLPASAYSWGWARFVRWGAWLRVVRAVRAVEVPLQIAILAAEVLSPLALLDTRLALAFFLLFAIFHVGVFLLSGLLFWDWIGSNVLVAWLLGSLTDQPLAFGPAALLVCTVVLVVFPLRHRIWKPLPLAWFDSPLTQRMVYTVVGQSGRAYGLYNDFMCPHERLYGRVNGCFLSRDRFITYHLGEVWKLEIRDAIVGAQADSAALDRVKDRYGISAQSDTLSERHRRYLATFFARLNAGAKKRVLPPSLSFFKAPGDQIYYFGENAAYRRQEPVREVRVSYREEYFDGERLVRLLDEAVEWIEVPLVDQVEAALPELTPRELDVFLLRLAQGRLVQLPPSFVPASSAS